VLAPRSVTALIRVVYDFSEHYRAFDGVPRVLQLLRAVSLPTDQCRCFRFTSDSWQPTELTLG